MKKLPSIILKTVFVFDNVFEMHGRHAETSIFSWCLFLFVENVIFFWNLHLLMIILMIEH